MKVLAIDTSTMMSSIAILDGDTIIGASSINLKESHSEKLVLLIKRLLDDLKLDIKDIDLLAVSKGPGSFTGLRIGMTSVKAIAQALDKPIVGISTLEAMAFSILNNGHVLALIDARGTRYFAGLFHWEDGDLVEDFQAIIEEVDLYEEIKNIENLVIVGDGTKKLGEDILNLPKVQLAHPALNNAIGKNVAVLAKRQFDLGHVDNSFDLEPEYLRRSQAEIDFEKKNL